MVFRQLWKLAYRTYTMDLYRERDRWAVSIINNSHNNSDKPRIPKVQFAKHKKIKKKSLTSYLLMTWLGQLLITCHS
jgi:hypothetical protein